MRRRRSNGAPSVGRNYLERASEGNLNLLIHVVSQKFVAGLVCPNGTLVHDAPPIARYMVGWPLARVRTYAQEKGWLVHVGVIGTDGRTRWPLDLNVS